MRPVGATLAAAMLTCGAPGTPIDPEPYEPTRRDYASFAAAWPDLLEPNYLPFMVYRAPGGPGRGDRLLFCRWPDDAMPLRVFVAPVVIPEELQSELGRRAPEPYADAIRAAFDTWEEALEGHVRFRQVERERDAVLVVRLLPEPAPEPEPNLKVLGSTPLARACRVGGLDPDAERVEVKYAVPELRLFLADEFGLLTPDQVQWIALHEIGHALGMRGHSPIPSDLMYEVARDRIQVHEGLSMQDANSFLDLYRLPNGTLFGHVEPGTGDAGSADPGLPELDIAPYVSSRYGFEFHPPRGWTRVDTAQGMVAVDGTTWDYTASFQVIVHRYPTIRDFLDRYGFYYLQRGAITPPARLVVDGRPALQVEIALDEAPRVEQVTFIEVGDGRLIAVVADAPDELADAYRPWWSEALGSLHITDLPDEAWPRRSRRRPPPATTSNPGVPF